MYNASVMFNIHIMLTSSGRRQALLPHHAWCDAEHRSPVLAYQVQNLGQRRLEKGRRLRGRRWSLQDQPSYPQCARCSWCLPGWRRQERRQWQAGGMLFATAEALADDQTAHIYEYTTQRKSETRPSHGTDVSQFTLVRISKSGLEGRNIHLYR